MDLSTTYLGMRLPHPLIVGAGPLGRIRSLWALPPSPPSLRRLRERRRDAS